MDLLSDYKGYDDQELIRRITLAEQEALAELYERYHRVIFSLVLAIVEDRATAEEITLDVFVRVWQKAATYRADRAKVSTWLTRIAHNHAIDVLRHRSVRPDHQAVPWEDVRPNGKPVTDEPQESLELSLRRKRVQAALARLPADQKQVLMLAYFSGYTQRQIAQVLNQPLGTVKTRLRLGLQKLRDFLQTERELEDRSTETPSAYNRSED